MAKKKFVKRDSDCKVCLRMVHGSKAFVTQPLNRMRQNEKNRHKNRPCKWAIRLIIQ